MNDEQFFLANAYLDDQLTDDERAVAEADPEVMAEVEALRALQDLVRDVDPPTEAARDASIAAAMSHFGAAAAPAAPHHEPAVHRSRPSYQRYLAVAAGVLGVGLLGVAVANLGTGGDDDSASDEPAAEEPAEASRFTEDESFAADDVATAEVPAEEPAMDAPEEAADEPAEAPVEEPAEEPAEAPAEEPTDGGAVPERPELVPGQVLTTPEEVGSFGTGLLELQQTGMLPPTPNHACPIDDVLGRAEYRPTDPIDGSVDAETTTLLIAVDEPAGIVLGFDDESCELVVEGPLYLP